MAEFFSGPAARLSDRRFLLGGNGWDGGAMPANVRRLGHVYTRDHNAFNASSLAVLNIARNSMAEVGYSPATRVFEAAGAGACLITDAWTGLELFLRDGEEVLAARDGSDVAAHLAALTPERAGRIGAAGRARHSRGAHLRAARGPGGRAAAGGSGAEAGARDRPGVTGPPPRPLRVVVVGLSLSSSWGNGHATTFRALLKAFARLGHDVLFLERDVPWYAAHRDLPAPTFCRLGLYADLAGLETYRDEIVAADAVVLGSYVPEGVEAGRLLQRWARGATAFYDIDTPVTLAKLARGDEEYVSADLIPGFDLYLSFTGGPTLRVLEQRFGARSARQLFCSVDPATYQPMPGRLARWDLSYLGTYSPDRQPALDRLLLEPARRAPERRFAVAGPQYPAGIEWPANVERLEHVPPHEHSAFYAASRFTLNVTRADMVRAGHSPSVRLFEAAACGTPVLSDRWEGLDSVFRPEKEIAVVDTASDVMAALASAEGDRRAMAEAARRRVLSAHTADHRAGELEVHLLAAIARRRIRKGVGFHPAEAQVSL